MTRKYDTPEAYGLLTPNYKSIAVPEIVDLLRKVEIDPRIEWLVICYSHLLP